MRLIFFRLTLWSLGCGSAIGQLAYATGPAVTPPAAETPRKTYDCFQYEAAPAGSDYFYSGGGQWFYYLAANAPDVAKKDDGQKYTLYRLDMLTAKTAPIFSASLKQLPGLLPIGMGHLRGATILNFRDGLAGCYTGDATGVSLSLVNTAGAGKAVKSFALNEYRMVAGDDGARVADMKAGAIKEIDTETFQQRTAMSYPKAHVPIYASTRRNRYILLEQGAQNYLRAYSGGRGKADHELLLPTDWRILQQAELIALVHWQADGNVFTVRELPTWTNVAKETVYKLKVEPGLKVDSSSMAVNFKNQVIAFYGSRPAERDAWKKLYVYHYKTNRLIGSLTLDNDQYVGGVAIDPDGEQLVALLRSKRTHQHLVTKGFHFIKKTWQDYALP